MTIDKDKYVTAGELAALYGIPKQTLLYYDKNELLIPALITDNGYRYYSVSQYLELEIILNMRKLDIPVQAIKNYLENRSLEQFEQVLQEKSAECDKIIEDAQKTKASMQSTLKSLDKIRQTRLNQIQLSMQPEKVLLVSECLQEEMPLRQRFGVLSSHTQAAFDKEHFKEFTTGWIIGHHDFCSRQFRKTLRYFTPVTGCAAAEHCYIRPAGLYLTVRFQGTYYQEIAAQYERIMDFLQRNALRPCGDIYIFPLKNHWLTADTSAYINQISFMTESTDE